MMSKGGLTLLTQHGYTNKSCSTDFGAEDVNIGKCMQVLFHDLFLSSHVTQCFTLSS